jgi:glycosyltransferase involved in cell wall biosynthesis
MMINGYKITVVVPTYNEEQTIGQVLESLTSFKSIDQVVCVDDGSTDNSYRIVKRFKGNITIVHHRTNRGKGYALYRGVSASKGDIIAFFDSDNVEIVESDFIKLVKTLLECRYKMALGNPRGVHQGGRYDSLTGERIFFRKDISKIAHEFRDCGLGVESYINFRFKRWVNITMDCRHKEKFEKYPVLIALWKYVGQGMDMIRVWIKIWRLKLSVD